MQLCEKYYIIYVMQKKLAKAPLFYIPLVLIIMTTALFLTLNFRDKKLERYSDRIKNLEELVTARQIYRNVIYTEIKENFIVDKRSLFTINYNVTAGVDFSRGFSIDTKNGTVRITYSYPQILSIDADESSIEQYFALQRFGKLKQSDYLNIIFDEKTRIKEEALNAGILERADINLQRLISGILKEGGIENIRYVHHRKEEPLEN